LLSRACQVALGFCGRYEQIADLLDQPGWRRRLVILGEPGAGKSVMAIRLVLDLIARRGVGDPVPRRCR